jgi:hypothetical protein
MIPRTAELAPKVARPYTHENVCVHVQDVGDLYEMFAREFSPLAWNRGLALSRGDR